MSELLDIGFPDLPIDKFVILLQFLVEKGNLKDFKFNFKEGKHHDITIEKFKSLKKYLPDCYETPVSLRFDDLTLGKLKIPNASVITEIYNEHDSVVIISFDLHDIGKPMGEKLVEELMDSCQFVCKELNISDYYGGVDPSEDLDCRFFTNGEFGEYYINYIK